MLHGEWLFQDAGSETAVVMERTHNKSTGAGYTGSMAVTPAQVIHLAECFEAVFDGLGGYIGDAMKKLDEERDGALASSHRWCLMGRGRSDLGLGLVDGHDRFPALLPVVTTTGLPI